MFIAFQTENKYTVVGAQHELVSSDTNINTAYTVQLYSAVLLVDVLIVGTKAPRSKYGNMLNFYFRHNFTCLIHAALSCKCAI